MSEPFGARAPTAAQDGVRALAHRLPYNYWGRKAASLLLGPAGGRARRAYDVVVFDTQRARLHPFDNICEKRVFLTPRHWDLEERALLAEAIAAHAQDDFAFADIGANVGLYTLFARAECARRNLTLRAVCVEADPEMQARLAFNIDASGAKDDVRLFACAASDKEATERFAVNRASRGMSRIDGKGEIGVRARPLLSIVEAAGLVRIDAMKIDIEGREFETLGAFFHDAPEALWPRLLLLETSHEDKSRSAETLAHGLGYRPRLKTLRNAVLQRGV